MAKVLETLGCGGGGSASRAGRAEVDPEGEIREGWGKCRGLDRLESPSLR